MNILVTDVTQAAVFLEKGSLAETAGASRRLARTYPVVERVLRTSDTTGYNHE
jgi:hypothetical protein